MTRAELARRVGALAREARAAGHLPAALVLSALAGGLHVADPRHRASDYSLGAVVGRWCEEAVAALDAPRN